MMKSIATNQSAETLQSIETHKSLMDHTQEPNGTLGVGTTLYIISIWLTPNGLLRLGMHSKKIHQIRCDVESYFMR